MTYRRHQKYLRPQLFLYILTFTISTTDFATSTTCIVRYCLLCYLISMKVTHENFQYIQRRGYTITCFEWIPRAFKPLKLKSHLKIPQQLPAATTRKPSNAIETSSDSTADADSTFQPESSHFFYDASILLSNTSGDNFLQLLIFCVHSHIMLFCYEILLFLVFYSFFC